MATAFKKINVLGDGSKTFDAVIDDDVRITIAFPSEDRVDQLLDLLTSACFEIQNDVEVSHA